MKYRVAFEGEEQISFSFESNVNIAKGDYIFSPEDDICKVRKRYISNDWIDLEVRKE